nr:tetraspanin-32 isoform X2 [Dasypus novemcinctus]
MPAAGHRTLGLAVVGRVALERNPYQAVHRWACYAGMVLAALLSLGALLSAAAAAREAEGLMAGGFLCFALVFCALAQVAFWRLRSPSQVEDAVLDVYDLVYERALRGPPGSGRQELAAVQDAFGCCGKSSPFSLLRRAEVELCPGAEGEKEDCLRGIRGLLRTLLGTASTLTCLVLALMVPAPSPPGRERGWRGAHPAPAGPRRPACAQVYAMLLSAFLWFAIRAGCGLDRRGRYSLTPR